MIHAMIDLETLSTKPNATILTIGGVKFDAYTRVEPSQGLYHRIDVDSQSAMGRDVMERPLNGGANKQRMSGKKHWVMMTG